MRRVPAKDGAKRRDLASTKTQDCEGKGLQASANETGGGLTEPRGSKMRNFCAIEIDENAGGMASRRCLGPNGEAKSELDKIRTHPPSSSGQCSLSLIASAECAGMWSHEASRYWASKICFEVHLGRRAGMDLSH